jgi:hypothetical protein
MHARAITTVGVSWTIARLLAANVMLVEKGAVPDGVTVDGLKLQDTPAGNPEQANVTDELKPLTEVIFSVTVAGVEFVTVTLAELAESAKSGTGAGATETDSGLEVDPVKLLSPL